MKYVGICGATVSQGGAWNIIGKRSATVSAFARDIWHKCSEKVGKARVKYDDECSAPFSCGGAWKMSVNVVPQLAKARMKYVGKCSATVSWGAREICR